MNSSLCDAGTAAVPRGFLLATSRMHPHCFATPTSPLASNSTTDHHHNQHREPSKKPTTTTSLYHPHIRSTPKRRVLTEIMCQTPAAWHGRNLRTFQRMMHHRMMTAQCVGRRLGRVTPTAAEWSCVVRGVWGVELVRESKWGTSWSSALRAREDAGRQPTLRSLKVLKWMMDNC